MKNYKRANFYLVVLDLYSLWSNVANRLANDDDEKKRDSQKHLLQILRISLCCNGKKKALHIEINRFLLFGSTPECKYISHNIAMNVPNANAVFFFLFSVYYFLCVLRIIL